jgi:hypothetical protein
MVWDRDRCQADVNTKINPRVPHNEGDLLSSWPTITLSGRPCSIELIT